MTDRPGLFRQDILEGPATLARALEAFDPWAGGAGALLATAGSAAGVGQDRIRRVLLVGMGSSRFAALSAVPFLRDVGLEVEVELASTSRPVMGSGDRLVVAISNSGSTPEVVAAAERHRGRSALVVAVTNDPGSPLARAADVALPLWAGVERAGIACRTYGATVASLMLLADRLAGSPSASAEGGPAGAGGPSDATVRPGAAAIARAIPVLAEILDGGDAWLPWAVDLLDGAPAIHVLGDTARFGSVEQAALMLREAPRLAAVAFDAGDWLHVGLYTALPGIRVVLLSGTAYDAEVTRVVRERGGEVLAIGRRVDGAALSLEYPGADDPGVAALVETSIVELAAAELWARADATDLP